MQAFRCTLRVLLSPHSLHNYVPTAGVKSFSSPKSFEFLEYPERSRLKVVSKVPQYPPSMRPFKMQKRLVLMRGPEIYHNTLLHKQYGIIATQGGRMKHCHFEMIRFTLLKNMDFSTGFAVWRVQEPWQPVTKKSQGHRMGGGKGSIDHYVTPVRVGQVIVEVGGPFEYFTIKHVLKNIANKLPFAAMPVTQEILKNRNETERRLEEENQNPWTWKYIIQNNILGCNSWLSRYDRKWFKKYL
ncbi:large ribosomal subunit protein uL16m-like [Calliopsis andreniformis]|uniref:large ribosomal subunit protein uL16m-like n=1 Tax=Calliopsis andreniformis TaxID=337506 RepID=UPI003FCDF6B6